MYKRFNQIGSSNFKEILTSEGGKVVVSEFFMV